MTDDKGKVELSDFEGKRVVAVGVEMPNAAGGLQKAMQFDPVELHHGDEGFVVLHYTVGKVRFEPIAAGNPDLLRRVHVFNVDQAAPIDTKQVRAHLDRYRQKIEKAKEEAEGVQRLPGVDSEEGDADDNVTGLPIAPGEGEPDDQ